MIKDYDTRADVSGVRVKSNYHTHNYLCGHAGGEVCDYVAEAVRCGFEVIGISDHCVPPVGSYEPYITSSVLEAKYLSQFEPARELYGDKIKILSAVEIEYFAGHDDYYRDLLTKLDYLVLGQHEYMNGDLRCNSFCDGVTTGDIVAYCKCVKAGLKTGFFSVFAHPDLIFYQRPHITSEMARAFDGMIKTAVECGVAVELNANGIRYHGFRYPTDLLIDTCKKYDAPVVVSSDAHNLKYLNDEYTRGMLKYAQEHGLNVIDQIKLPEHF
ncbi:MAG: PHP domain-containing protein [Clostridiales bacterium]|nr:PHP domain-containing protein [Clostridiales bacterium]